MRSGHRPRPVPSSPEEAACFLHDLVLSTEAPFSYPVRFTRGVLAPENDALSEWVRARPGPRPVRALAFLDAGLVDSWPDLPVRLCAYAERWGEVLALCHPPMVLAGGEEAKNSFGIPHKVIRLARRCHLCRQSLVLAVGGGAFLDAVGFAASLIHRGVRLVRVPTTVLAQNDSGVGVKNGLNLGGVKNFLGTFAPPAAVFNDSEFLRTLSERDWTAGIAEAYKVAVIKDASFLDWLVAASDGLRHRDLDTMEQLIRRCAGLHVEHIMRSGDPFESGSARPLDFGHWAAHKLESLTVHGLRHGEAVAIGMAIDLLYAAARGLLAAPAAERVVGAMANVGLPVWHEALEWGDPDGRPFLFSGIEEFREHLGGELHVTLPNPIGRKTEVSEMDEALLTGCLGRLRELACELGERARTTR